MFNGLDSKNTFTAGWWPYDIKRRVLEWRKWEEIRTSYLTLNLGPFFIYTINIFHCLIACAPTIPHTLGYFVACINIYPYQCLLFAPRHFCKQDLSFGTYGMQYILIDSIHNYLHRQNYQICGLFSTCGYSCVDKCWESSSTLLNVWTHFLRIYDYSKVKSHTTTLYTLNYVSYSMTHN